MATASYFKAALRATSAVQARRFASGYSRSYATTFKRRMPRKESGAEIKNFEKPDSRGIARKNEGFQENQRTSRRAAI
jgi:hypothetical protein